jgi:hypothetical protein
MLSTLHINCVQKILSAFWKWGVVETEFFICYAKHLKRVTSIRNAVCLWRASGYTLLDYNWNCGILEEFIKLASHQNWISGFHRSGYEKLCLLI